MKGITALGLKASAILFSTAVMVACNSKQSPGTEFAPDMYHSIPLDPYSQVKPNLYNPGGLNMREPARGTVARGKMGYNMYLTQDTAEVAGTELKNPFPRNAVNLNEGKVLYTRFCAPCHGDEGDGQGLVGQKFLGVPAYASGRVASLPAGHIYHVITNGRGRMRPHGSQVNPDERWKIVLYVQQLQTGDSDISNVTAEQTEIIEGNQPGTANPVTGSAPNN